MLNQPKTTLQVCVEKSAVVKGMIRNPHPSGYHCLRQSYSMLPSGLEKSSQSRRLRYLETNFLFGFHMDLFHQSEFGENGDQKFGDIKR